MTDDPATQWTDEAKNSFVRAAESLSSALRTHAVAVSAASSDADTAMIDRARDALKQALEAYDEAQYDYSGTFPPFAIIEEDDAELGYEASDEVPAGIDGSHDVVGVTVLQRMDYKVTDPRAVIAAGAVAQRASDGEIDGPINDVGDAMYALAHGYGTGGWNRLGDISGIDPVANVIIAVANEALLPTDPDDWPDDSLSVEDGELLFQEGTTWQE